MAMKTLYNITKNEAKVLVNHFSNDKEPINSLALLLWSRGKASDLERAVYKAKKLVEFSKN
jgi:hypothetical protein